MAGVLYRNDNKARLKELNFNKRKFNIDNTIGVGRFRIFGGQDLEYWGARFRILGGGQIPSRNMTS